MPYVLRVYDLTLSLPIQQSLNLVWKVDKYIHTIKWNAENYTENPINKLPTLSVKINKKLYLQCTLKSYVNYG